MICELFIFVVLLEFFPRYFSESFLDSIPEERKKMSVRSMFPVICVLKTLKLYSFINKVTISHNSNYKNLIYVSSFIPIEGNSATRGYFYFLIISLPNIPNDQN